jgi:hypothetical protein
LYHWFPFSLDLPEAIRAAAESDLLKHIQQVGMHLHWLPPRYEVTALSGHPAKKEEVHFDHPQ